MKHLRNVRLWRAILLGLLMPLAVIAFWPSPVDQPVSADLASILKFLHVHGIPAWFDYKLVEAAANVVLFVPLGAVTALAYPKLRWWHTGLLGFMISGCMEAGQLLFLHNRFASMLDLVTNAGGAVIGALLAAAVLKFLGEPSQHRMKRLSQYRVAARNPGSP